MKYYTIIAADVGDLTSNICVMTKKDDKRQILEETIISTTQQVLNCTLKANPAQWELSLKQVRIVVG